MRASHVQLDRTARGGPAAPLPDRLRDLARQVSRLAVTGRLDPELVYVAKASIAGELTRLARELEA